MIATRHVRRSAALAASIALAAAMIACGDDDVSGLPDPPASPPATATSTVDPEHQEILDVYYRSVEAMVAAHQAGDPEHPELSQYFVERTQALHNLQNTIRRNEDEGMYYAGPLVVASAEVVDVDLDDIPPRATIESCVDYTDYELVHREDGSAVDDEEPLGRYQVTAEALYGKDERWYITTNTAHWDEPC